jgi:sialidase-1
MKTTFVLSILIILLTGCTQKNIKQSSDIVVFQSGSDGYQTFRIPALIKAPNGDLLAFCEGRVNNELDAGDIDLVMRRSKDNGKSWGKLKIIWDDNKNTCGNPAPVVDYETGEVFLVMTWNLGSDHEGDIIAGKSKDSRRVFITSSSDNGNTRMTPREITMDIKKNNWTWYATGPVHGIQKIMEPNKGRLIIPCDHSNFIDKKYYSHIIYSDDHGKNWSLGGITPQGDVNECTIAELAGGKLLLNMRNYDREYNCRKVSYSMDGGLTFADIRSDMTLIEPVCQAAMLTINFEGKDILLFSNPASQENRLNMTVKISLDGGESWPYSKLVYSGQSAYSDMVVLDNGKIGLLYEKDDYQKIAFSILDLKKIIK